MTTALALPSIVDARLPAVYEQAKEALAECSRIDECADWADKAMAMASYAKQANDDSLLKTATRIKARAIRRCGELLKQIEAQQGARTDRQLRGGAPPKLTSRTQAARDAGLSDDQRKNALRVASIPEPDFEAAVESDDPPTVTELAERGTKSKPKAIDIRPAPNADLYLKGRSEADFKLCTEALGHVRRFLEFVSRADPAAVVRGTANDERERLCSQVPILLGWLSDVLRAAEGDC